MTLSKEKSLKLAESWAKKAERAYNNYQDSGAQRYYNAYQRANDMEDACRMAANAADEHEEYMQMRSWLANFAARAACIQAGTLGEEDKATDTLLDELAALGRMYGFIGPSMQLKKEATADA